MPQSSIALPYLEETWGVSADFGRMQPALVPLPEALPAARSGPKPGRATRAGRSAAAGAPAPGIAKAGRLAGVQLADGAAEAQLQHGDEDWTPADEGAPAETTKRFGRQDIFTLTTPMCCLSAPLEVFCPCMHACMLEGALATVLGQPLM